MKIKADFVTNSSSCSFTIPKRYLNEIQILFIKDHIEIGEAIMEINPKWDFGWRDAWIVKDMGDELEISTTMDNFDMKLFLEAIGVPEEAIENYNHSNIW